MRIADIVGGVVGVAIGSYIIVEGAKMPLDHIMKIGPSFFPNMLAIALIGFSVILIVQGALAKKGGGFAPIDFRDYAIWRAIIALSIAFVYAFLLKPLGFLPGTTLFVLALMLLLGSRKPLSLVLTPPSTALGVWLVFEKLLTISLPAGIMSVFGL